MYARVKYGEPPFEVGVSNAQVKSLRALDVIAGSRRCKVGE